MPMFQISDFIPMFDDLDPNEEKYSLQILKCFPEFNQVVGELQLLQSLGGQLEAASRYSWRVVQL